MAPIAAKGEAKEGRGDTEGREYRSLKSAGNFVTRGSDVDALRKRGLIPDGRQVFSSACSPGQHKGLASRADAVIERGNDNGALRSSFDSRESAQSFSPNKVYLPTLSLLIRMQSMDCFSDLSALPLLIYWSACSTANSESLTIGCKTVTLISPSLID